MISQLANLIPDIDDICFELEIEFILANLLITLTQTFNSNFHTIVEVRSFVINSAVHWSINLAVHRYIGTLIQYPPLNFLTNHSTPSSASIKKNIHLRFMMD